MPKTEINKMTQKKFDKVIELLKPVNKSNILRAKEASDEQIQVLENKMTVLRTLSEQIAGKALKPDLDALVLQLGALKEQHAWYEVQFRKAQCQNNEKKQIQVQVLANLETAFQVHCNEFETLNQILDVAIEMTRKVRDVRPITSSEYESFLKQCEVTVRQAPISALESTVSDKSAELHAKIFGAIVAGIVTVASFVVGVSFLMGGAFMIAGTIFLACSVTVMPVVVIISAMGFAWSASEKLEKAENELKTYKGKGSAKVRTNEFLEEETKTQYKLKLFAEALKSGHEDLRSGSEVNEETSTPTPSSTAIPLDNA